MSFIKPTLPRGTRDFSPEVMVRRNYILQTIKRTFEKFGFLPLETPAIENLSVLTGKYGDEGDQLLFKILNSGNFLKGISPESLEDHVSLTSRISDKGLRYDLTVPFARYVVMNRGDIAFPFKRYQMQPVWRADRPQKGRYREFYQCDADVIGTDSLICEAEIAMMVQEVFNLLGMSGYRLKINSRKILEGIAEVAGDKKKADTFFVILDKLDKIGIIRVKEILSDSGFSNLFISKIEKIVGFTGDNIDKLAFMLDQLKGTARGETGIGEVQRTLDHVESLGGDLSKVDFDFTLARGLSYYTGVIFEAQATGVNIGSIGGGGRYDNLTGVFGLPQMPGVGFSFGIDRVYDVMDELDLFSSGISRMTDVLITNFDPDTEKFLLHTVSQLRKAGIKAEIYPDQAKLKKQLNYANKKNIPYVLMIGSEEMKKGIGSLKNMKTGKQKEIPMEKVVRELSGPDPMG